jgi:hypothetical protein
MSLGIRLPEFDMLVTLHQQEPDAFEAFRRHLLREAVDGAPPSHRPALEKLLCRIEETRAAAATPMEAVVAASRMMQESVGKLHATWEQARQAVAGLQTSLIIERLRTERFGQQ